MQRHQSKGVWIVPLPPAFFNLLSRIAYRATRISIGERTVGHRHVFFSFYLAKKIRALEDERGAVTLLPKSALVIVLPFVQHSWTNVKGAAEDAFVFDLTPLHRPHAFA